MSKLSKLPNHFNAIYEGVAQAGAVVQGKFYRFTILTDRMIRLEYAFDKQFEDRPSQIFVNRLLDIPNYEVLETDQIIDIKTKYLHLRYDTSLPFSQKSLSIVSQTGSVRGKGIWRYGFKETKNLKGTARTLDGINGKTPLEDGLFSEEGYTIIDDSQSIVIEDGWIKERNNQNIDLYYLGYDDDYEAGIKDFYKVAGKTPLIPRFALGNWWSRYWPYSDQELKEHIQNFKDNDIPLSVTIIDMDWHLTDIPKEYGTGWTGYTWNKDLFKEPKETLDWLHKNKLKVGLNLHPALGIRPHEACYDKVAEKMGIDPTSLETVPFNITNLDFLNTYFEDVHHPHEAIGVDFWWIDWQQGKNTDIEGLDPLWMLNHYHFLDRKRDLETRGFTFSRFSGLGSHRTPIGFSGDTQATWDSLAFQPFFTANATLIGYGWWSHDIGGHYHGETDPELYTRWVQYGVFSPVLRLHSSNNYYSKRAPFDYDEKTKRITSHWMRFRHALIPYIYTLAYLNSLGDLPLIRPMMINHPSKRSLKNQYYFGDALIVSPVVTPLNTTLNRSIHSVWLPKGSWFDFFSGEAYLGDRSYTLYTPLDSVPVFAKAGSIIPLSKDSHSVDNPQALKIVVFPQEPGTFTLYEDDGQTLNYEQGEFVQTHFRIVHDTSHIRLEIDAPKGAIHLIPKDRTYHIHINGVDTSCVAVLKGVSHHRINLDVKEAVIDPKIVITKALRDMRCSEDDKRLIGYVQVKPFAHQGGLLASHLSRGDLLHTLNQMTIDQDLKDYVLNELTKHTSI